MSQVPFADPPWLRGLPSPYFNDSHRRFQVACRKFLDENLHKDAMEWETAEDVPADLFTKFAKGNFLIPALPAPLPVEWLHKLGVTHMPGEVPVEEWDALHTMIYSDEMSRSGLAGPPGSLTTGMAFGVPPLLHYANADVQNRFLPDLLLGKKRTCIAITEPDAGSDVANITTTAELKGNEYIINGAKKWITNGVMADFATIAVRTGAEDSGGKGISLLVVPLANQPGVSRRRLKVAGQIVAGTSYLEFDDVRVPRENLIGKENEGMKYIMHNFNHERMFISVGVTRQARVALSAAFAYCMQRRAFDKTLIEQPVVRHRLAKCGAILESQYAWVESFAFQLSKMPKKTADEELGGLTALCKANAGIVLDECARCAVLLFGGNGYTRTGKGEIAEKIYREVPGARIPGGSEDVLLDLAIRQLTKRFRAETEKEKTKSKM
ncbi:putative acyl-CoA dehydrogenase [Colletotrichum scovillei]|uniref:Acyl-CoA dehydrogenase n=1 Tax=Colletotrichum scovillei TaxID=1209932 RepID=A0A9P7QUF8_9PEZI|nr:putative acyl-CoA dehydrogenase [Colletotrichum scovillei]KAG7041328.1 putative acyl-CoA dehydrogenase [Colletotrichum scovillei]KAG7061357.1 putative acyl-CoA dehydrogenase [Colletotrichum scovillei]